MKQYVIDELRPADYQTVKKFLDDHYAVQGFDGLYRIEVPQKLLSATQKDHQACGPFYFAVELMPRQLSCELLVRSQERIRCDCIGYATQAQRDWIVQLVDGIFEKLSIVT